jgi:hypothetical protein
MSLTVQATLALALQCAPAVDPHMIVAIGQHESGLDPLTIHDNTTGQILHGQDVVIATRVMAAMDDLQAGRDPAAVNQAAVTEITEQQQSCNARPEDVWERDACEPPKAEGDQEP